MRKSILKLSELDVNSLDYPRDRININVVNKYVKDMEKGDVFPPLYVGQIKGKGPKILIDGRHRYEAYLRLDEKYAQCELKINFVDRNDMYLAAVRANSKHGLRYSRNSLLKISTSLDKMGVKLEDISKLTGLTIKKLQTFVVNKAKHIFIQDRVRAGELPGIIREKIPLSEKIKIIDDKEIKKLELANIEEFQEYELGRILNYVKTEKFEVDSKPIEQLLRKIKKALHKRYPKL